MKHDFSLEKDIFDGGTEYIDEISTDLNSIQITFRDLKGKHKKILKVVGFNNLNITLDSSDEIVVKDDDFSLYLLIGFSFEKNDIGYLYCIKTSSYEMSFNSRNYPLIMKEEQ